LFFLANRKKLLSGALLDESARKEIPLDVLEKLVNKIKNHVIMFISSTNDQFRDYDPYEFTNKEDDIEILELEQEDEGTINNSLVINNSGTSDLLRNASGISNNSEVNISRAVSVINRDVARAPIRKKVKDVAELSKV
jgi:hypothetical protein